jgi:hypothetical protein
LASGAPREARLRSINTVILELRLAKHAGRAGTFGKMLDHAVDCENCSRSHSQKYKHSVLMNNQAEYRKDQ